MSKNKSKLRLPPSAKEPIPSKLIDLTPPAPEVVPTVVAASVPELVGSKVYKISAGEPALNSYANATTDWYGALKGTK